MHRQRTEMALLLPIVLLSICCFSAAAPQDGSEIKTILTNPGGDAPPSVIDINSVLRDMSVQIAELQRQNEVRKVAFSTSLLDSGDGYTGPFDTFTNLIFKHVFENIGNAYNPLTGLFTAPVRGAYHFEFYIYGIPKPDLMVKLMKNDQMICTAQEYQSSGGIAASNGVTLVLEVGDVVFLRLSENTRIFDDAHHYTTFSGHLLFTM